MEEILIGDTLYYKCKWCEQMVPKALYRDRKFRHHPERVKGFICYDCFDELKRLDNYTFTKIPQTTRGQEFMKKLKKMESNEIRQRWGNKIKAV